MEYFVKPAAAAALLASLWGAGRMIRRFVWKDAGTKTTILALFGVILLLAVVLDAFGI